MLFPLKIGEANINEKGEIENPAFSNHLRKELQASLPVPAKPDDLLDDWLLVSRELIRQLTEF